MEITKEQSAAAKNAIVAACKPIQSSTDDAEESLRRVLSALNHVAAAYVAAYAGISGKNVADVSEMAVAYYRDQLDLGVHKVSVKAH